MRARRLGSWCALAALLAAAGCTERPGRVEGRVRWRDAGAPGITVEAWLQPESRPGTAPFASVATAADGSFALELPPGRWYLSARDLAAQAGPRRVADVAGNPVRVERGGRTRLPDLELRAVGERLPAAAGDSGIRGRALLAGAPAADAAVMVYDAARTRLAGPGYLALVRTGPDGRFQVELPPGEYRVAVRRRRAGAAAGFLQPGDASAPVGDGPVRVAAGAFTATGDVELQPVDPARLAAEAARGFQGESATAVEGVVVDRDGKPAGELFVFAFRDERMIGRPEAVARAGADGRFALALPGGGRYFIGARSGSGGPRQPGEWSGELAGAAGGGLDVPEARRVRGLRVVGGRQW
jgi:hypothetical protein